MGADMEVGMEEVTMTTTEAEVEISAAVILEDLVVDSVKGSTVSEISIRGVRKKSKSSNKNVRKNLIESEFVSVVPTCQIPNILTLTKTVQSNETFDKISTKLL